MNKDLIAHHQEENHAKTVFGFWVYLMTDCMLFGSLFATYAVLHNNTFGGPSGRELFSLPFALTETLILLTSSFTCGIAMIEAELHKKKLLLIGFGITFLLGLAFIGMEISEFRDFVREGNSWERSGFLSAFFTLVATHGAHITVGLIWMAVMMVQVMRRGITPITIKRMTCLRYFWHFLDVVWIFIFTLVYLLGAV